MSQQQADPSSVAEPVILQTEIDALAAAMRSLDEYAGGFGTIILEVRKRRIVGVEPRPHIKPKKDDE